jgi:integrative and conjugative element protein (TIGR02256 family)
MSRARICLAERVIAAMCREADRRYPRESGGVLLGWVDSNHAKRIKVIKQIGPGPKAGHETHRFEPDGEWQARRIAAAYENSGRTVTYLGDWHSHPRGGSTPSELDRSTARKIAEAPEARAPHPLILILHGRPGEWEPSGYRRGRRRLRKCRLVREEHQ